MELKYIAMVIVAIGAIFILPGSCHVVPPGHRGVSVFLGKVDPVVKGEGMTSKVPWLEDIVEVPVQQISQEGSTEAFSADLQTVTLAYTTLYRIPEGKVVELYQQYKGDPYDALVKPRIEEAIKQVAAQYRADEMVKTRETIKGLILEKLKKELSGIIEIRDIPIRNIDLSDLLEAAIETKQVKEQQALAKDYELKQAVKEAEITIVKAKAEAESIQIAGTAIANNPLVVQLKLLEKWDGKSPNTVVTSEGGANILLPIEKK